MCCGFGAVVLLFMVLKHEAIVKDEAAAVDLSEEVAALQAQIAAARADGAAAARETETIDEQIAALLAESASARELLARTAAARPAPTAPAITQRDVDALRAAIRKLETEKQQIMAQLHERSRHVREFVGHGGREYLTGIRTGGRRVLILLDDSASMLDASIVNVLRKRNMDDATKRRSEKWLQAIDIVDWIAARLKPGTQYQIYAFNTAARAAIPGTEGRWLAVDDTPEFDRAIANVKALVPDGGSNLARAIQVLQQLQPPPDSVFLITDGLPTQGLQGARGHKVSGAQRSAYFEEAVRLIPQPLPPFNVILLPMEGDPMAPWAYWSVAMYTRGAFLTPAYDWP